MATMLVITRGYEEAWDDPPGTHDPMIPGFSHRPIMKMSTLDEFQPLARLIHWEATIYLSIREWLLEEYPLILGKL